MYYLGPNKVSVSITSQHYAYHSSRETFIENIDDFFILFLANLFGIIRNLDLEIELSGTCDRVRIEMKV